MFCDGKEGGREGERELQERERERNRANYTAGLSKRNIKFAWLDTIQKWSDKMSDVRQL